MPERALQQPIKQPIRVALRQIIRHTILFMFHLYLDFYNYKYIHICIHEYRIIEILVDVLCYFDCEFCVSDQTQTAYPAVYGQFPQALAQPLAAIASHREGKLYVWFSVFFLTVARRRYVIHHTIANRLHTVGLWCFARFVCFLWFCVHQLFRSVQSCLWVYSSVSVLNQYVAIIQRRMPFERMTHGCLCYWSAPTMRTDHTIVTNHFLFCCRTGTNNNRTWQSSAGKFA